MEAVVALALGVVVFMQAWQLFGLSQPKTTGTVGVTGAIVLVGLVIWNSLPALSKATAPEVFASSLLLWAIYAALVAAVGLWNVDARGLGFYSAFAAVGMIGQVFYSSAIAFSATGIICGLAQAVAFVMLFLYLAIPLPALKRATAWVLVVVGPIHGLLAVLMLMKLPGVL